MPFREMRRFRQQLSIQECETILARGTSGVLAVAGDGGWPYAVPLSYVYEEGKLLFHCARAGHKLDALRSEPRASFCVVDQDQVLPERYTTAYRSVIAFGQVHILEEPEQLRPGAERLGRKYYPEGPAQGLEREIDGALGHMAVLEMTVEHITGKQARELMENAARKDVIS